jgi:transcriptional regulator with XRE-family HTH domain
MKSNIKDVARRAGVSIATVSHVINNTHFVSEDKRRRVFNAIEGLNYRPNISAQNLRSRKLSLVCIFVCEIYAAKSPRLLLRAMEYFSDAIESGSFQAVIRFVSPRSIISVLESQPDFTFSFLITDTPESYGFLDFKVRKIFALNMNKNALTKLRREDHLENRCHYVGYFYFTALANFISDNLNKNFCFFATLEDLKILRELCADNVNYGEIFTRIKVIQSEVSAAQIELLDLLEKNTYEHIYITDFKFALGTVRLLLLKPYLIQTKTEIIFFNYDTNFEDFNLCIRDRPFFLSKTNVDEIIARAKEAWA